MACLIKAPKPTFITDTVLWTEHNIRTGWSHNRNRTADEKKNKKKKPLERLNQQFYKQFKAAVFQLSASPVFKESEQKIKLVSVARQQAV